MSPGDARADPATLTAETALCRQRRVSQELADLVLRLGDGARPADIRSESPVAPDQLRRLLKLGFLELRDDDAQRPPRRPKDLRAR